VTTESGSTLLETVWALLLAGILAGASFSVAMRFQEYSDITGAVLERDASLKLLPLLCSVWLASGGCSIEPEAVAFPQLDGNRIRSWADLDGPDGFPDGDLDESFENIRVGVSGGSLTLQSGRGTAQPALTCLSEGRFRLEGPALIRFEFAAVASPKLGDRSAGIRSAVAVALRNRRVDLVGR
jgi:hypothetical protein